MRALPLKLYFDGGCRPNPGPIEVAVVSRGIVYVRRDLGCGSNDDAEWLALRHAIKIALSLGADDIVLLGDSKLVVNQAAGLWKCRSDGLRTHLAAYRSAVAGIARVRLRYVPRSKNLAGIALAAEHPR